MNNSNFSYDCRNNFENCFLAPVIDEREEISFIRKHKNTFDSAMKDFISTQLLETQINEEFDNKISQLDRNSHFFEARKNSLEIERKKHLDSIQTTRKQKRFQHKRGTLKQVDQTISDLEKSKTNKMIYELNPCNTATIKALGIKKMI